MADKEHKYTTIKTSNGTIIRDDTIRSELDKKDYEQTNVQQQVVLNNISRVPSLFGSLILILVGVCLIRILYNGVNADIVTFSDFLELLSDVPKFSNKVRDFVRWDVFPEPWEFLDSVRIFIRYFVDAWSILIWLSACLVEVVVWIGYFIAWLFV